VLGNVLLLLLRVLHHELQRFPATGLYRHHILT
jgi:hypothetical protein